MVEKPFGIIGDGQLALLTARSAIRKGIPFLVMGRENSPASFISRMEIGDVNNAEDLKRFASKVMSINLDREQVNVEGLKMAEEIGTPVFPKSGFVKMVQNRILQKTAFDKAGIPIAPWAPAGSKKEIADAYNRLGQDVFIKTAEEGIDGKGNKHVDRGGLEEYLQDYDGADVVVEKSLDFRRELATIIGRDQHRGRIIFPITQSFHKNGILDYTMYPSKIPQFTSYKINRRADELFQLMDGPGLLGVEMFDTYEMGIVINEISARTHNTGHWTIDGCSYSQFDAIVDIASGQHLEIPRLVNPGKTIMMKNLIGGLGFEMNEEKEKLVKTWRGNLIWYNKEPEKNRKVGHLTVIDNNRTEAKKRVDTITTKIGFIAA